MDIDKLVSAMTVQSYQSMCAAVETGKWPNGVDVTPEQKQNCLQLIIAWDHKHKGETERTGYLPPHPRTLAQQTNDAEQPLNFKER